MTLKSGRTTPTSWPSVAVIVPNHARIASLQAALASIVEQTYAGAVRSYLVYRDRPEVAPLLDTLGADVVPIAFADADDRNPIAARRNRGIEASSEDLVAFLDDDDVWHRDKLRHQVETLQANADSVATCTAFTNFAGAPTWPTVPSIPYSDRLSYRIVLRGGALVTSSLVVRSEALSRMRFDERREWQAVEDYDFKLRLHAAGPIDNVRAILTGIRVANSSVSTQDRRSQHAKGLSVLSASTDAGAWRRRLAVLERLPVIALSGSGPVSAEATLRLREALNGRLFGPLDPVLSAVIRAGWNRPAFAAQAQKIRDYLVRLGSRPR